MHSLAFLEVLVQGFLPELALNCGEKTTCFSLIQDYLHNFPETGFIAGSYRLQSLKMEGHMQSPLAGGRLRCLLLPHLTLLRCNTAAAAVLKVASLLGVRWKQCLDLSA